VDEVLALLFPPRCQVCDAFCADLICEACFADFRFITPPYCDVCGRPFDPSSTGPTVCGECRSGSARFDAARAIGRHTGALRQAILNLKFHDRRRLAAPLADLVAVRLEVDETERAGALPLTKGIRRRELQAVIPVPLHTDRLRTRGYNQSELIARHLADRAGLPLWTDVLVRVRPTRPQTEILSPAERRRNVAGAFEPRKVWRLTEACVLVFDDVFTTGSTMNECARVLKRAGAARVDALTPLPLHARLGCRAGPARG
jgi:ComF family protein